MKMSRTSCHTPRAWTRPFMVVLALALSPCCLGDTLPMFSPPGTLAERGHFAQHDGESLYRAICQGCHMADARGAHGAGNYPALSANSNLASALYTATTVLGGRGGMPQFDNSLSDEQVADVINYVRSHFDNGYTDNLMTADIARLRASSSRSSASQ
ncbi:MAG: cytochrome c [Dokdonella sp.]